MAGLCDVPPALHLANENHADPMDDKDDLNTTPDGPMAALVSKWIGTAANNPKHLQLRLNLHHLRDAIVNLRSGKPQEKNMDLFLQLFNLKDLCEVAGEPEYRSVPLFPPPLPSLSSSPPPLSLSPTPPMIPFAQGDEAIWGNRVCPRHSPASPFRQNFGLS